MAPTGAALQLVGPYDVVLAPGVHELSVDLGDGQIVHNETFELAGESSLIVNYIDATYSTDLDSPRLRWILSKGRTLCM